MSGTDELSENMGPEISFGRMKSNPFFGQMLIPQVSVGVEKVMEENHLLLVAACFDPSIDGDFGPD